MEWLKTVRKEKNMTGMDDRLYNRGRDALADSRYEQEYSDQRADAKYSQDRQKAAAMAQYGFFGGYADLWGLPQETVDAMVAEYAQQKQTTKAQAARDLADWYAQYGDFSQLRSLGVNTSVLEKQQALALAGKTGSIASDNPKKKLTAAEQESRMANTAATLKKQLAANMPDQKKLDAIQGALDTGSITEAAAQELLRFIGYDDKRLAEYGY